MPALVKHLGDMRLTLFSRFPAIYELVKYTERQPMPMRLPKYKVDFQQTVVTFCRLHGFIQKPLGLGMNTIGLEKSSAVN